MRKLYLKSESSEKCIPKGHIVPKFQNSRYSYSYISLFPRLLYRIVLKKKPFP